MKNERGISVWEILAAMAVVSLLAAGLIFLKGQEDLVSALEKGERPSDARETLGERLKKDPNDLAAQSWLLRLEIEEGDTLSASRRLAMLEVKFKGSYEVESGACLFYMKNKNWSVASNRCNKALKVSRRTVEDLNLAAASLLKAGKAKDAKPILLEAQEKSPNNYKVLNNLGFYYLSRRDYDQAFPLFKKSIVLNPAEIDARKNLARAYFETKRVDDCVKTLEEVLALDKNDAEVLVNLAVISAEYLRQNEKAREYATRALALGLPPEQANRLLFIVAGKSVNVVPPPGSELSTPPER